MRHVLSIKRTTGFEPPTQEPRALPGAAPWSRTRGERREKSYWILLLPLTVFPTA
jgi:hypothetical protein